MFTFIISIIINLPFIGEDTDFIDPYDAMVSKLDYKYGLNHQNIKNLSYLERDNYYRELEKIKLDFNESYNDQVTHKTAQPGDIFLTSDSETFGLNHGHAAINSSREFETIESDNLRPVSRYPNQVNRYWKNTPDSKRYQVIGAEDIDSQMAAMVAENEIGKPYCFNPLGNSCYFCTKLIWAAWDSTAAKNKIGHYYLAPDMMKSKSLKLVETYMK